jgi:hypothetical protein
MPFHAGFVPRLHARVERGRHTQEDLTVTESEKKETNLPPLVPDTAADHVEKKPKPKESPQQTHDDEDHG